jgi:alpha-amylase/alpha-mannosidase (GH57 family)
MAKLYLSFLWHMHQPFYKDRLANRYYLPWVRLHAIRGYYDLPVILSDYPNIKTTFNLTPVLLYQLQDYCTNKDLIDDFLVVTLKRAELLNQTEKEFILTNFFMINWEKILRPHLRYFELLNKRGIYGTREEILRACKKYGAQDFLDLQVLFNLLWFGPMARKKIPRVRELIEKGTHYTEEEKHEVIKLQLELVKEVIALYKSMSERNLLELTASPFYHPILPLLWNGGSGAGYSWEKDAKAQVSRGLQLFESIIGEKPKGVWPSEGSVSESIVPVLADCGVEWIATDEDILFHSGQSGRRESLLYQPYWVEIGGKRVAIFFRDRTISDLIGFSYSRTPTDKAVDDFLRRIYDIKRSVENEPGEHIIPVILDGENPWDYYEEGGELFLRMLCERLGNCPDIETICFSEYLKRFPPNRTLNHLYSGSWINHNFNIWYSHEEDFQAWDYVKKTRDFLEHAELSPEKTEQAWEELYAAEGSDWYWWFGDDFSTTTEELFDFLFRNHLANVYRIAGKRVPAFLKTQIKKAKKAKVKQEPSALITPILDGKATTFYEWYNAGFYAIDEPSGAMQQGIKIVQGIYYGFDLNHCYFRIDINPELKPEDRKGLHLALQLHAKEDFVLDCGLESKPIASYRFSEVKGEEKLIHGEFNDIAIGQIVEIRIPFARMNTVNGDKISFIATVENKGVKMEEWPRHRMISFQVPDNNFEDVMWNV